jgi:hypothetical protein
MCMAAYYLASRPVAMAAQHQRALADFRPCAKGIMTEHQILVVDRCESDVALKRRRLPSSI